MRNAMPTGDACLSQIEMLMSTVTILHTLPMTVNDVAETNVDSAVGPSHTDISRVPCSLICHVPCKHLTIMQ